MDFILHYNKFKDPIVRKSAMYQKIIAIFILFFSQTVISYGFDFQTTRLKSTGGAGVGSILMDEATVLNPAPLAFFNLTAVLIQRTGGDTTLDVKNDSTPIKSENYAAIISDSKGPVKGSVSYIKGKNGNGDKNDIISVSTAYPIDKSAIGVTYRRLSTTFAPGSNKKEETSNQYVLGASHNISPSLSVGAILTDPFSKNKNDSQAVIGGQVIYGSFISLMLDVGANYNFPLDETLLYKGAVQIMFFTDVYLRAGYFNDKGLEEKGTGVGLGWVQPRLALEAALKNSKGFTAKKTERETSFSLSYRF